MANLARSKARQGMTTRPAERKRNRLLPWFIGLAIVLVVIGYAGYQMVATSCPVTPPIVLMVLGVVPFVYLALMYLAFTSQE